mmetsp:Transcript_24276/g.28127  ORF Transcript_24276/g.28127 Transcript_24276/m.28127 type:complete len:80 (+) Transcript_24276:345-584(+)
MRQSNNTGSTCRATDMTISKDTSIANQSCCGSSSPLNTLSMTSLQGRVWSLTKTHAGCSIPEYSICESEISSQYNTSDC